MAYQVVIAYTKAYSEANITRARSKVRLSRCPDAARATPSCHLIARNQSTARSPSERGTLRHVSWAYIWTTAREYTLTSGRFRLPRRAASRQEDRRDFGLLIVADSRSPMRVDDSLGSIEARIGIFLFFFQDERRKKGRMGMEFVVFLKIVSRLVSARDSAPPLHVRVPPRVWRPALRGSRPRSSNRNTETWRNWPSANVPAKDGALGCRIKTLSRIAVPRWLKWNKFESPSLHTHASVKMDNYQNTSRLLMKKVYSVNLIIISIR